MKWRRKVEDMEYVCVCWEGGGGERGVWRGMGGRRGGLGAAKHLETNSK